MDWDEVSIIDLEAKVSPEILARGQEYRQTGHIIRACRFGRIIAGEVAGTGGSYRVRLTIDGTLIDGDCTCPYPGFCKHMVALTLAWIEKSIQFIDLELGFNYVIQRQEHLPDLLVRLIQKDPLNYLDLISDSHLDELFLNSRGVLNLIRNTFQGQSLTLEQIETLWERVQRIKELVAKAIAHQEKDAPVLLRELVRGVAYSYKDYSSILLRNTFDELILLGDNLPESWPEEELLPYIETLWEIYLDCNLWELAESVRGALKKFYPKSGDWLLKKLEAVERDSLGQFELRALYELLSLISGFSAFEAGYFKKLTEVLDQSVEGKLWLIDRIMEQDPDQAFRLAKEGIRNSTQENKQSFRERLIEIHLKRSENKQAAALSFIQFEERPNLEEYLRLKTMLAGSRELKNYLLKLDQTIEEQGLNALAARIAFDQENWLKLEEKIGKIEPGESVLKELAELIITENKLIPFELFESLATRMLEGGRNDWETVLSLLVNYKKLCVKNFWNEEWSRFRVRLSSEFGEDSRFVRKFGAILAG